MNASPRETLCALRATDARTIAVSGCSKNAGKTTAMNVLTAGWDCPGLMSIGIDGEDADFWLGVPKPRISASTGTVFATAERTLAAATAGVDIIERTGIVTPLGEIVLARTLRPGMVLLAGVRHKADVLLIRDRMRALGVDKIVIDGAYQRLMSADPAVSDGMILATGAILGATAHEVAEKTMDFVDRIRLEPIGDETLAGMVEDACRAGLAIASDIDGRRVTASEPGPQGAIGLLAAMGSMARHIAIPGSIPEGFTAALGRASHHLSRGADTVGLTLLVQDPTRVFLKTSELAWLARRGHRIAVARPVRLLAIAVNPVSVIGGTIPSGELISAIEERISGIPVLDFVAAAG